MNLDSFFLKFNYAKKKEFKYFQSYIKKKSDKDINIVLHHLHIILNKVHKTELTKKQWSIILGPWLSALNNIYEHKKILLKKKKFIYNFYFLKKNKKNIIPKDITEFVENYNSLIFNQNIFNFLIHKKVNNFFSSNNLPQAKLAYIGLARILIAKFFIKLFYKKFTIIVDSPLSFFNKMKLFNLKKVFLELPFFKKNLKIFFFPYSNLRFLYLYKNIDYSLRKSSLKIIETKNYNDKNLKQKLLFFFSIIPSSYLENFDKIKFYSKIFYLGKNFYCRVSNLDNEFFKIFIAFNKSNLYLDQHGGNFSFNNKKLHMQHDFNISKKIFFWDKINNNKFKSTFNSLNLILKNSLNINHKIIYDACYVLSFSKKYDFQSQFFENYDHDYKIKQLKIFFENFNRTKDSIIKIAPKRYQFQSNYQEYSFLKKNYPTVVEDRENLFKSKILIFESFSTAIFETRFSNIPFVIITNISNHFLSAEGRKIIQILKSQGLFFSNALSAAKALNKINDYKIWWASKDKILNNIFYNMPNKVL